MKDKELRIRMDSDFEQKVDYLKEINGYKNKSDTIRRTVEKEYRKEKEEGESSHNPKIVLGEKEKAWLDELKAGIEYLEGEMKDIAEDFTRIPKEDFEARKKNMSEFLKREKAKEEKREIIKMLEEGRLRLG